jgi:hypothetical protein
MWHLDIKDPDGLEDEAGNTVWHNVENFDSEEELFLFLRTSVFAIADSDIRITQDIDAFGKEEHVL